MRVLFEASFARDLQRIRNKKLLDRVQKLIDEIKAAAALDEIKHLSKLKGTETFYRIRLGDYRVGVEIIQDRVVLVRILHRKDIYRYFP
ncbi:MAG: type II toxin-antitoxin system RelE/ParE family toxin [Chloroflexia bacterium]|nr:type II toxin-antitoxin system RelE/ParE family toxin [Chloroflexia bacterium]